MSTKIRHPSTLSGGQKQRLCIGIAKLKESQIICFDEPTSGLDYKNMIKVTKIIKELAVKSTIVLSSHDMEFMSIVCDRILELKDSKLEEFGGMNHA